MIRDGFLFFGVYVIAGCVCSFGVKLLLSSFCILKLKFEDSILASGVIDFYFSFLLLMMVGGVIGGLINFK